MYHLVRFIRQRSGYGWFIWALAALFYAYEFLLRVSPSVMAVSLMQDLQMSAKTLGIMSACYYYAYASLQIPAGLLVDKLGARRLLVCGAGVAAFGALLFALAHTVLLGCIARFLMGLGSAVGFVCCLKLVTHWFPPYRFALLAGLTNFLGYVGASMGGTPLGYLVNLSGWRQAMLECAILGVLLALAMGCVIRNQPKAKIINAPTLSAGAVLSGLKTVMRKPQNWVNALVSGLMVALTATFADLWGIPYLTQAQGSSQAAITSCISLIFIGVAAGSPFFGWISDRLRRRIAPLIIGIIGEVVAIGFIIYGHQLSLVWLYVLCFGFGFCQSSHVINFAIAHEINDKQTQGTAIGLTNLAIVLSGALFQPLVGFLLDWKRQGLIAGAMSPLYTVADYQSALLILPICGLIALGLTLWFLREPSSSI